MTQLIKLEGEYYQLVRQIKVETVGDNLPGLKAWRDLLKCDRVLKYQDSYLLVRTVEDAIIVEEEIK